MLENDEMTVFETEDALLAACFQWHHNNFPELRGLLFHVPNELPIAGEKGAIHRNKMKAKGVVKGVSDFVYCYFGQMYFIELKLPGNTAKNRPTEEQMEFLDIQRKHGAIVGWLTSLEAFQKLINRIHSPGHGYIHNFEIHYFH